MENNLHKKNQNEHGIGPIVGTLIIVVLLMATAVYIWSEHLNATAQIDQEERDTEASTTVIYYSTSTEPSAIEADLKTTPPIQSPGF